MRRRALGHTANTQQQKDFQQQKQQQQQQRVSSARVVFLIARAELGSTLSICDDLVDCQLPSGY
jgi:hypothetical protein